MKVTPRIWGPCFFAASMLIGQAALGKVTVQESTDAVTYKVSVEDVRFDAVKKNGEIWSEAKLVGVDGYDAISYEVGQPQLPVVRFFVDGSVEVSFGEATQWEAKNQARLVPAQPSRVKLPTENTAFVINDAAYDLKTWTKTVPYTIEDAGSVRGVERHLVTLYPLQYAPGAESYRLIRDFKVTAAKESGVEREGPETFAFIVAEALSDEPALHDYMGMKKAQGFATAMIVVSSGDTPETIRTALKDLYASTHLKYALVIGDSNLVPAKNAAHISGVTDHYYRAIDTDNYDSDINGPDIGVGRISVQTTQDLRIVLEKYRRYTNGQFSANAWLNGVAFLATNDRYTVAEGSHNYAIDTYTSGAGYLGVFPQADQPGGDKLYAITHRVSDAKANEVMAMGRTIINYSGHGATTFWDSPGMRQSDVRALDDENAMPFVISNACITGKFTVDESFGETWQRHSAGAIMFWGSMDNTYWDEDDILERRMYDGIYALGKKTFAEITEHALSEHWRHYGGAGKSKYYWETYVTFGDPSIALRTTYEQAPRVDGPDALPVGIGSVSYKVSDASGNAVVGARVGITDPVGEFRIGGVTNENGEVVFDITTAAAAPTDLIVTVVGQNLVWQEKPLTIIPSNSPYLAISDYFFNDRDEAVAYVAEEVALGFAVTNFGQQRTAGGTVILESIEGPATIDGDTVIVPAMAGRDVYEVRTPDIRINVSEDAMNGEVIRGVLKWETQEGQSAKTSFSFTVKKAEVTIDSIDFGTDGRGIGPGETGEIFLTLTNIGGEDMNSPVLSLSPGTCLTNITDVDMPSLAAGETARLATPVTVTVDAACANGDLAEVAARVDYQSAATMVALGATGTFAAGVEVMMQMERTEIGMAIPDDSDAVEYDIEWTGTGLITDVGVMIEIRHTYIGDLTVELVHPDGTAVMLHNREGGGQDNLRATYGLNGTDVGMDILAGKSVTGIWKIRIQDNAGSDTGTLDTVALTMKGYIN